MAPQPERGPSGGKPVKTTGMALWSVAGLMTAALLLQGCGSTAAKPKATNQQKKSQAAAQPQDFRGPLPALDAVEFLTADQGFVAGQGIVLETSDGGQSWTRIYGGSQTITSLAFVATSSGYALTSGGQVLAYRGAQWQSISGLPGSASAIWLSGPSLGELLTTKGTLYQAVGTSGGWQAESLKGVIAACFQGSRGWAVTGGLKAAPKVWLTENGGATWAATFSPGLTAAGDWSASVAASGTTAWLLFTSGSGQLEHQPYVAYVTHDLGQNWQEVLGAALFAQQGMYPAAPQSLYGLQAGPLAGDALNAYFVSWQPGSPNDILAITATADGGQSWHQMPVQGVAQTATPYFFGPLGFAAPSGGTLWLVGSRAGAGRMLVSHDGGLTWQAPTF